MSKLFSFRYNSSSLRSGLTPWQFQNIRFVPMKTKRQISGFPLVGGLGGPPYAPCPPIKSKNCPPPIFVDHDKTFFRYFFDLCMAKANLDSITS